MGHLFLFLFIVPFAREAAATVGSEKQQGHAKGESFVCNEKWMRFSKWIRQEEICFYFYTFIFILKMDVTKAEIYQRVITSTRTRTYRTVGIRAIYDITQTMFIIEYWKEETPINLSFPILFTPSSSRRLWLRLGQRPPDWGGGGLRPGGRRGQPRLCPDCRRGQAEEAMEAERLYRFVANKLQFSFTLERFEQIFHHSSQDCLDFGKWTATYVRVIPIENCITKHPLVVENFISVW